MSFDFYDQGGRAYAYSDDGEAVYTFDGMPIAFIENDSIYGYDGRHIGYFNNGAIFDPYGNTLLFTNAATAGPMKPMLAMKPMKGMKQMKPMKGMKQMKPMKPMSSMGWSQLILEEVFRN